MKILHVNTHLNAGGIGQYIVTLASALKDKGVECVVASSGGELVGILEARGIRHRLLDIRTKSELSPKVAASILPLKRIIAEEKIDLLHAHTRVSQVTSFFASAIAGTGFVSTCHGYFKPRLSRRLFDTWGKKVIAISGAVERHLADDFRITKSRIRLVHNGIDLSRFSKDYSAGDKARVKKLQGLGEGPVIGTMGRLSPVKGQRYLVEAMKSVISKRADAQCLIVGRGGEEPALRQLALSAGISERICFAGCPWEDVPLYLSCMDIFVLPSVEEGLGLALLEAMARSLPCIGSDTGGIRDIIKEGINGLLVKPQDSGLLAKTILMLLEDKKLAHNLAAQGREEVKKNFSSDKMADGIIKVYKEVLHVDNRG